MFSHFNQCDVSSDDVVTFDSSGEEGAEPEDEALNLPVYITSVLGYIQLGGDTLVGSHIPTVLGTPWDPHRRS